MLGSLKKQMADAETTLAKEFMGGLATFLTLSYIFLLNPVLLAKTGMPIEAAFFGTVVAAAISTAIMGIYAKVPFAIAPAPSITTFFVGYVCLELGLSWQAALGAVVFSGLVSIAMAHVGAKAGMIRVMPEGLKYGVIFCLSGFLIASGLRQAGLINFIDQRIVLGKISTVGAMFTHPATITMLVGLFATIVLSLKPINFRGSPIFGILVATAVATSYGIIANRPTDNFEGMTAAIGAAKFSDIMAPSVLASILILFIIDFFGGVGKFVGLQKMLERQGHTVPQDKIDKALVVDGFGNVIGGLVGASSLAVFISSAIGIKSGARTGVAAIFCAVFMLLCLALIPIVGAIPAEATAGILVYIGLLLVPWDAAKKIFRRTPNNDFKGLDLAIGTGIAIVTFCTFSIDFALMILFVAYSLLSIGRISLRDGVILYLVTLLLIVAVIL